MSHRLQRTLALMMVIGLLSILLTGCGQSNKGTENGGTAVTASPGAGNKATAIATANSGSANVSSSPSSVDSNQIVIESFSFKPAKLTINVGAKITWVNKDEAPHTATSTNKSFNSGALDTNAQFSNTFTTPGTYPYFCALHPQMKGQIIVK